MPNQPIPVQPRVGSPFSTPATWYWTATDGSGRIYSAPKNALVYSYDTGYVAFTAGYGIKPWPVDASGNQTTASLQAVVSQYGITLPFP